MKELKLTPIMTGNLPGGDLFEFFNAKLLSGELPSDFPGHLLQDLSCTGFARLITGELGEKEKARIFWHENDAHAYVVPINARDDDPAFNNDMRGVPVRTAGFLRRHGQDVTDEYFAEPWERL